MINLATAVIFFFIGRWSVGDTEIIETLKEAKKKLNRPKTGKVVYKTAAQIREKGTAEEAEKKVMKKHFDDA